MTAIAPAITTTHTAKARLEHIDALRGFALFGILAVNIWAFADPFYGTEATSTFYDHGLDRFIHLLTSTFFETKFYLLFSFLFGYSFTLQMASAERAGASFVPRMLRRQLTLLAIGVLHGLLLFHGEILSIYALLGLVLLLGRHLKPRTAVVIALGLTLTACSLLIALGWLTMASGDIFDNLILSSNPALTAFHAGPLSTLAYHVEQLVPTQLFLWLIQGPSALAMFLLGYAAGRRQWLVEPCGFSPYEQRLLKIALPLGLTGALFYGLVAVLAPGSGLELLAFGVGELTAPLLAAAYAVLMLRWFRTPGGQRLSARLAPMGRMSLSNYILQSVMLGLLFSGYGLRLMNELPSLVIVLLVALIFALQLWISAHWMRRHQYGPMEWLLRSATLLTWPNWRRASR